MKIMSLLELLPILDLPGDEKAEFIRKTVIKRKRKVKKKNTSLIAAAQKWNEQEN